MSADSAPRSGAAVAAGPEARTPLCPSAPAESEDGVVFAVRALPVEDRRVTYLPTPTVLTRAHRDAAGGVALETLVRVAAPCAGSSCLHSAVGRCTLAGKVVDQLRADGDIVLPVCHVRQRCVWFAQEGREICLRCPQVITRTPTPTGTLSVPVPPVRT